jgi:hypothetical protein
MTHNYVNAGSASLMGGGCCPVRDGGLVGRRQPDSLNPVHLLGYACGTPLHHPLPANLAAGY